MPVDYNLFWRSISALFASVYEILKAFWALMFLIVSMGRSYEEVRWGIMVTGQSRHLFPVIFVCKAANFRAVASRKSVGRMNFLLIDIEFWRLSIIFRFNSHEVDVFLSPTHVYSFLWYWSKRDFWRGGLFCVKSLHHQWIQSREFMISRENTSVCWAIVTRLTGYWALLSGSKRAKWRFVAFQQA